MGGLIALCAFAEHPRTFGGAASVSTHWPAGNGATIDCLRAAPPVSAEHRVWMDHGTATLDFLLGAPR